MALIRTKYYRSPQLRGCGGARAMRPEQAKQIIRCKGVLTIEAENISLRKALLSCQLQSTGLQGRDQVPRAKCQNEVP